MLRVHMDSTPVWNPNPRGIGTYIINLIQGLLDLGVEVHAAFKFSRLQTLMRAKRLPRFAKKKVIPFWMGKIQLFHGTNRFLMEGGFAKVLTVHDMIEFYPSLDFWFPPGKKRKMRQKTEKCFELEPQQVIAVSNFAKSEILQFTNYPEERISVIYHGIPTWAKPTQEKIAAHTAREHGLAPGKYLVFVGQPESRKNLGLVLRAMSKLKWVQLLVAGGKLEPAEADLADKLNLRNRILELGFVPGEELSALLSGSLALAFPSRYEGFGLPIIEAMACGTPVITSTHPATAEAAGPAGITLHPDDVEGFVAAAERLLQDKGFRASLVQKGLERAGLFSWRKTAEQTITSYRRALNA